VKRVLEARDSERQTPLYCAIYEHKLDIAKCLVEHGADLSARSIWKLGDDALKISGAFAHKEFTNTLLSRGLDVYFADLAGFTCLHKIAEREDMDEQELTDISMTLIQAGVDLSSNNCTATSPLHCASHAGNSGLVKLFLGKLPKEELEVKSKVYGTPLYAAAFRGHLEVTQLLLDAGADMTIDWLGQAPLEAAQEGEHDEVIKLLMEH